MRHPAPLRLSTYGGRFPAASLLTDWARACDDLADKLMPAEASPKALAEARVVRVVRTWLREGRGRAPYIVVGVRPDLFAAPARLDIPATFNGFAVAVEPAGIPAAALSVGGGASIGVADADGWLAGSLCCHLDVPVDGAKNKSTALRGLTAAHVLRNRPVGEAVFLDSQGGAGPQMGTIHQYLPSSVSLRERQGDDRVVDVDAALLSPTTAPSKRVGPRRRVGPCVPHVMDAIFERCTHYGGATARPVRGKVTSVGVTSIYMEEWKVIRRFRGIYLVEPHRGTRRFCRQGDSGGPLVLDDGRIAGMIIGVDLDLGLGYALPLSPLLRHLEASVYR